MPTLHLLGTGAAFTDAHRTTTMLALVNDGGTRTLLIDCGGDVVQRAQAAGLDLDTVCGMFLTHEHPDHVSGFPLFMEKIWLAGRSRPIDLFGIDPAIDQARRTFATFDTASWALPEMRWHSVAHVNNAAVMENDDWRISASPGVHGVPVVGLRIECLRSGRSAAYSCDTEPCEAIENLARDVDLLIHEASGGVRGHSSASGAAQVAKKSGAKNLVLVHLPPKTTDADLAQARSVFRPVRYGVELEELRF